MQTAHFWNIHFNLLRRSIFDLAIAFDSLVPLPPTIWLTAVKHESLSFFQRNKDPRAYIGKFWDSVRIQKIVWILVLSSCFFFIFASGVSNLVECTEKVFFDVLIQGFLCWNTRNVIFRMWQPKGVVKGIFKEVLFRITAWLAVNRQKITHPICNFM